MFLIVIATNDRKNTQCVVISWNQILFALKEVMIMDEHKTDSECDFRKYYTEYYVDQIVHNLFVFVFVSVFAHH